MEQNERELLASLALEDAAEALYEAGRERHPDPLPDYESDDAREMRIDARYRAKGAHKRGDARARIVAIERVAIVLAVANGDIWPDCDNQVHRGISDDRRAAIVAMRRQRYRHQAALVCAAVAKHYEIDADTPEVLAGWIDRANFQRAQDTKTVVAYKGHIGKGEVVTMGLVE